MRTTATIVAASLGALFASTAARAASLTEWQLPFPSPQASQIAVGSAGVYYIDVDGDAGISFLGRLDPVEGKFKEIQIPFAVGSGNDLQVRPSDGAVFTCDGDAGQIVQADVDGRELRTWLLPAAASIGLRSLAFDDQGRVLFLSSSFAAPTVVGRLDPTTGLIETWQVPEAVVTTGEDTAAQMVRLADGSALFNLNGFAHPAAVARLDLTTGVFTSWVTPVPPVFGLAADGSGAVYFQETGPSLQGVARLIPSTNVLTEWTLGSSDEFTQNLIFESGRAFFGTDNPVALFALDPSVAGSDSTLSPLASDPVVSASVVVSPVVTRHVAHRHGHAKEVDRTRAATVTGAFTRWKAGTAEYVAGDGAGGVYYTGGTDGLSIAKLVP
jgi:streptogramin lyase